MAESILTGQPVVRQVPKPPARDPIVDLLDMQRAEIARLQAELEKAQADVLRLTQERATAVEAAAVARGDAAAAAARAVAAERIADAEKMRADKAEADYEEEETQCEALEERILVEVEGRARAEADARAKSDLLAQLMAPGAEHAASPAAPSYSLQIVGRDGNDRISRIVMKPEA